MSVAATTTTGDLRWAPPGPGSWTLVADHYPRPITATHEAFLPIWSDATTSMMGALGLPVEGMRMEAVNGLPYVAVLGDQPRRVPPPWVLSIAARLTPSLRRSERHLQALLEERPWNQGVQDWRDTLRPAAIARLRALSVVDVDHLDDGALADHLLAVRDEWRVDAHLHISLGRHDHFPVALFLAELVDEGIDVGTATSLLAGSSPGSAGRSDELDALWQALDGRPLETLDAQDLEPDVAAALHEYLVVHGWRLVDGYDVDGPCLVEVERLVLGRINRPPSRPQPSERSAPSVESLVRSRLDPARRTRFDEELAEARRCYGVRDDNGLILISWPTGLLRRAMRRAGTRLATRGVLADPALAIEATPEELADALHEVAPLDEHELAARQHHRRHLRASDAPPHLGAPPVPPPAGMPGALGRVMRAFEIAELGATPTEQPLTGLGIGSGRYEGTARLVLGAGTGLDRFAPGDVLVAPMTSPSCNGLLTMAGALVTDAGGLMSHAAVMARELGLPAVIGTGDATTCIADGARIAVDPDAGTIEILHLDPRPGSAS